jgi:hypothetical protein
MGPITTPSLYLYSVLRGLVREGGANRAVRSLSEMRPFPFDSMKRRSDVPCPSVVSQNHRKLTFDIDGMDGGVPQQSPKLSSSMTAA